jgi:hypothetical protein
VSNSSLGYHLTAGTRRRLVLQQVLRVTQDTKVAVDLFHVVQQAVKTLGDVRRRAIREKLVAKQRPIDCELDRAVGSATCTSCSTSHVRGRLDWSVRSKFWTGAAASFRYL